MTAVCGNKQLVTSAAEKLCRCGIWMPGCFSPSSGGRASGIWIERGMGQAGEKQGGQEYLRHLKY